MCRLSGVIHRINLQQTSHAALIIFGLAHLGPFGDARVNLISRNVFGDHNASATPIALQGIGVSEVLANLGCVLACPQGVTNDVNTAIGFSGQSKGEAQIRRINIVLPQIKLFNR